MALADAVYIPLAHSYLCADCQNIGNNACTCPACASASLLSLARIIDRGADFNGNDPQAGEQRKGRDLSL